MKLKEALGLLARYVFLLIFPLLQLAPLYMLFTPLTLYPVLLLTKIFYPHVAHEGILLIINTTTIMLVEACIAGAAYYLLLILAFATPLPWKKRLRVLVFLWLSFLLLNILRITLFIILFVVGFSYFDLAHRWVWYLGSTFVVVGIWFAAVKIYAIKNIPFFTDIKALVKNTRTKRL